MTLDERGIIYGTMGLQCPKDCLLFWHLCYKQLWLRLFNTLTLLVSRGGVVEPTPSTGHQPIIGLTCRDKQPFSYTLIQFRETN